MNFDQGEFNFDATGPEDGYRNWRQALDEKKRAFEKRWGLILGRRVLIQLIPYPHPIEGIAHLVSDANPRRGTPLRLRVNTVEFTPQDIDSIVRIDDPPDQAKSP